MTLLASLEERSAELTELTEAAAYAAIETARRLVELHTELDALHTELHAARYDELEGAAA